jgi:hypothetical protein
VSPQALGHKSECGRHEENAHKMQEIILKRGGSVCDDDGEASYR